MDYPSAVWWPGKGFGYPNMGDPGRQGHAVVAIVDHISQGWQAGLHAVLTEAKVGWHYSVLRNGTVEQHVREADAAWACGIDFRQPYTDYKSDLGIAWIADCWRDKVSPNKVAISIEHEGFTGNALTEQQIVATIALHKHLCAKHGIPPSPVWIVGHCSIDAVTRGQDPGLAFPWQRIFAELTAPVVVPPPVEPDSLRSVFDDLWGLGEITHPAVLRGKVLIGGWQ
jgi:N-acetyl-anhydromuramyl-L-alanine amidase AmpD